MEKTMTDKKQGESEPSEKKAADEKPAQGFSTSISLTSSTKPSPSEETKSSVENKTSAPASEKKSTMKTPEKKSTATRSANKVMNKQKLSKIAIISLIIALLACAGVGYLYYWGQQQQTITKQDALQQTTQRLAASEQQMKQQIQQLLTQQQTSFSQQLTRELATIKKDNQLKISQLEKNIARLSQNQPSDWLLHEAEYLIRIATRTLWLEQDTRAAIGLLQDADMRLKEIENPELLPIRQLIREDISQLKLMPKIDSEDGL
jgi:uroporphyrin-3 C-methyltransferase